MVELSMVTVILAFGTLRQEDHQFEASLGHIERPVLKKRKGEPGSGGSLL
jgi:hypothetical protein